MFEDKLVRGGKGFSWQNKAEIEEGLTALEKTCVFPLEKLRGCR